MSDEMRQLIGQVLAEVSYQDGCHPQGFPPGRNGIRAGIAAVEDETREAREEWHVAKRDHGDNRWNQVRRELVQVAAVALRTIRELPRECNCSDSIGPGHSWNCPADPGDFELLDPGSQPPASTEGS